MTLLHFDGFEGIRKAPMSTTGIVYDTGRAGGQSGKITSSGIVGWTLPVTVADTLYMGFGYKYTSVSNGTQLPAIVSAAGAEMYLKPLAENGTSPNHAMYTPGSVMLGNVFQIPFGVWSYVEIMVRIATTGGRIKVRVDGATVLDYTGNTRYQAGTGGPFAFASVGCNASYQGDLFFDDLYVLDNTDATATQGRAFNDFLGPVRVEQLLPNGNGASSQFTGSDGNSVDNYLLVDESGTPAAADYVSSTTVGQRDLYDFSNTALTVGTIYGVDVVATAQDSTGSGTLTKSVVRTAGGTVSAGAGRSTPVAWAGTGDGPRTKDPDGALWTIASLNGAQYGIEVG